MALGIRKQRSSVLPSETQLERRKIEEEMGAGMRNSKK